MELYFYSSYFSLSLSYKKYKEYKLLLIGEKRETLGIYLVIKRIVNDFKRIKASVKISDVMKGEGYSLEQVWKTQFVTECLNPSHQDNNPSLQVSDKIWQATCFVCWAKYDLFNIIWMSKPSLRWKQLIQYVENTYISGSWEEIISPLWGKEKENFQDEKWYREMMQDIALYWSENVPKNVLDTYLMSTENITYKLYNWASINMQWYGLSENIIEQYMIGYSPNNSELYKLLLEMYDKEQIEKTQLFDSRGLPKFKNRLTIPYFKDWDVVYFTSRQTEYTPINKYDNAKYMSQSIENKYLYNEDDLENICVFICEWPMDCLALKNIWYNAIALSGISKSSELSKHYEDLESCLLAYICFDNDWWENWAWNVQAQKLDEVLRAQNISSHQVNLPLLGRDKIDISEYLWTESKEALNKLLSF